MDDNLIAQLRELMAFAAEQDLEELTVESGQGKVSVRRGPLPEEEPSPAPLPPAPPAADTLAIRTPVPGMFYRAAEPGGPPLVREGDWIRAGQPIGLVEAMKVFNEITTPAGGRVLAIKAADGQLVAEDEVLVIIERSGSREVK